MMHDANEVLVDRWSWVIPAPLITLTLEDMHSSFNWHYDIPYYEMRCTLNDQIQTTTAGRQRGLDIQLPGGVREVFTLPNDKKSAMVIPDDGREAPLLKLLFCNPDV